ncbi:Gfo/Idh/MocA family oxidoreductase [Agromyces sp. NPDC049794]|uniref:Gfo/Idh/MocA family protein n=1 Tax=unclassified Agromyces TaxID=2639701 RepID=UPI0034045F78
MKDVIVVGAGAMGRAWMDTIAGRADTRVCAIVDVMPGAAQSAARERGWDIPALSSLDEALDLGADLVLNATVPEAHLDVSSSALRAGIPVLSEKPVTPTVHEALLLAALSRVTGVLLAASQSRRHSAGIRAFKEALAGFGGAAQLQTRFFQNPRFGGFRDRMEHPLLVDMAIHSFDQARFLLDAEPVSVYCEEFNPGWSWYDGAAAAEAVFRFDDGSRFSYTGSWCADGLTTSWNGEWRGSAAAGAATWDGETEVLAQGSTGPVASVVLDAEPEGLDAALEEFVGALDGGPNPSGEIHRNVWSVAMVEASVTSARRGVPVSFAEMFADARQAAIARSDGEVADLLRAGDLPIG